MLTAKKTYRVWHRTQLSHSKQATGGVPRSGSNELLDVRAKIRLIIVAYPDVGGKNCNVLLVTKKCRDLFKRFVLCLTKMNPSD
jgi:hypothetical protein